MKTQCLSRKSIEVKESSQKIIMDEIILTEDERKKAFFNFVSGLAQEISSPLEQVQSHTARLVKTYRNREFEYISYREFQDIMDTIEQVNQQLSYCHQTTDRLISLNAKKFNANKKFSDVAEGIDDVAKLLSQRFLMSGVKIQTRVARGLPKVNLGPVELNQIIKNICENALHAMPAGGVLKIRASLVDNEKMVQIDFEDEGMGIERENMRRIFEPFFTTKERGLEKSSGLGLSIVHSIVKSVKGDICVESSLRKGTLVKIQLPVYKNRKKR